MYTADNILIDNIFVQFGGCLVRQVTGIPMGTNCAPLLADLSLHSYENEFLDNMIRSGHRRLARSFNLPGDPQKVLKQRPFCSIV